MGSFIQNNRSGEAQVKAEAKGYTPAYVNVSCTKENRLREWPMVLEKTGESP